MSGKIQIYRFGKFTDGGSGTASIIGGKGANLSTMTNLGLPVPSGFILPCSVCLDYLNTGSDLVPAIAEAIFEGIEYLTELNEPVLLSVRSGAPISMPGMMDTILNIGISTNNISYWRQKLGDHVALDSFRRLIQMYGSVVFGIPSEEFEGILNTYKKANTVSSDSELSVMSLEFVVEEFLSVLKKHHKELPTTVPEQVVGAARAVFSSWNSPRAITYRKINGIPDSLGTAVTVQTMVFGNLNFQSATGVVFSRCPSTGQASPVGEFLINAQGEDVVSGARTPLAMVPNMESWNSDLFHTLCGHLKTLEWYFGTAQDVEFTIQDNKLFLLQARTAKVSPLAAIKIAHDFAEEQIITREDAVSRVRVSGVLASMQVSLDPSFNTPPQYQGIAAGGGIVSGVVVLSSAEALSSKEPCILVTKETTPEDIAGINASLGIVTRLGGLTSHAAVVARSMNKTCVVGVSNLQKIPAGTKISIDGATGRVWLDQVPTIGGSLSAEATSVIHWAHVLSASSYRIALDDYSPEGLTKALDVPASKVTLECSLVYLLGEQQALAAITALGKALSSSAFKEVVIDLTPIDSCLPLEDVSLLSSCGVTPPTYLTLAYKVCEWSSKAKKVSVLLGPPISSPSVTALECKGVNFVSPITTVADLLNASGLVSSTGPHIQNVFGGIEAFNKVVKLVQDSHACQWKVSSTPRYWYELLGE